MLMHVILYILLPFRYIYIYGKMFSDIRTHSDYAPKSNDYLQVEDSNIHMQHDRTPNRSITGGLDRPAPDRVICSVFVEDNRFQVLKHLSSVHEKR